MQTTLQQEHQDQFQNNRGNSRQTTNNNFKSPSRTMYQQRYPVTFRPDNPKNNNTSHNNNNHNNYDSNTSNTNNNLSQIKNHTSPPRYRDQQQQYKTQNKALYNDVINMNHSLSRISQQINSNHNNTNNYQSSSIAGYADRTYTSPSRGTGGGGGFVSSAYINVSSPYTNANSRQAASYYEAPSGIQRYIDRGYQETYIKPKQSRVQLQKLCSQLKLSLQQSLHTQESLQQQLNKQRARSFQLSQMKRKLQQQLSRMQFQLDRISNSDLLGQKELMIKYENELKENERMNGELTAVREELKKLRGEYREIVTERNKLKQEDQMLRRDNLQLIRKLEEFTQHFKQMSEEEYNSNNYTNTINNNNNSKAFAYNNIQSQQSVMRSSNQVKRKFTHSPSIANINSINTSRSNNQQSTMYGKSTNNNYNNNMSNLKLNMNNKNLNTNNIKQVPQYREIQPIDYDQQNSKLLDDYNKLMSQNQSMKKLYQEFYQQPRPLSANGMNYQNYQIGEEPEEMEETRKGKFYHSKGNYDQNQDQEQNYQYKPSSQDPQQSQRLQTFQKTQLYQQVFTLRQQLIQSLIENYYSPSVSTAQQQKANVLVIFIKTINKNLGVIEKMVINYLQARDIMKKELQTNNLQQMQQQQSHPHTKYEKQAQQLWLNTKTKLKSQLKAHTLPNNNTITLNEVITLNINAYYLALFRLLTLIHKHMTNNIIQRKSNNTLSKIKHSALKYIHKIHEQTIKLKPNHKK